ncbi:hypothetical protein ACTXI4_17065 [Glutamicibacter ardleyensis]|uniref:hypothetical protein n=1 Tax=Glutamicibacter ardleyensis TaxID=225894 RepID=UPI003FD312C0
MTSNWETVKLGDLAVKRTDFTPVIASEMYEVVGVQRSGWGLVRREPIRGDSMKFSKLMKLHAGDLVYRVITAFEAPSAVVDSSFSGSFVTPQTFPVFELDTSRISPGFMSLLTTYPGFHSDMAERCTGSVLRRKTLAVGAFLEIPINLPPLVEQRRIVDLIGALDDAIEVAEQSESDLGDLLRETAGALDCEEVKPLGDLVMMRSGPSWKAADETSHPTEESTPVLGITNTPRGMDLDISSKKFVSGIPDKAMRLGGNSLIMIRTNGNRERIGNVYRSSPEVHGFAVSAFQIMIEPQSSEDASLIYWQLFSDSTQKAISEAASGSTGLGNVAVGWLKQMEIKYPSDRNSLTQYLGACDAVAKTCRQAKSHVDSLRNLRSELLAALLSGAHSIPESYDEVMSAV